jgi:3-phosphoshikimate 1-carboxyvinyltransferase
MQLAGNEPADWQAPTASGPVSATVRLPGSKSMTNRALILAALADDATTITGPLEARDTALMAAAVTTLGATVNTGASAAGTGGAAAESAGVGGGPAGAGPAWTLTPGWRSGKLRVDVGNAGTVLRFVPPAAALARADVEFDGDPRIRERPVLPLLAGLRQVGVDISDGGRGAAPFIVHGRGAVRGGAVTLDASASSQLVSGLMLAAPHYERGLVISHRGERVPSAPHIAMTVAMLTAAGAQVEADGQAGQAADQWFVRPGRLAPATIAVEPDLSNAAPFLAAALITGGRLTISGWPPLSLQPADQILDVLTQLGATCWHDAEGLHIEGTGKISGIAADLRDINELAPVLTAVAALADSPSELTGIGHMRFHETDRLAALAAEIGALGGDVTELPDGLEVRPRPLRAGTAPFDSHNDHRLVMAAAVLGLVVPGVRVRNADTVGKTFPEFRSRWQQMLGQPP